MAHSTCGHKAVGAECTNRTPRVVATDIPSSIAVGTSSPTSSAWMDCSCCEVPWNACLQLFTFSCNQTDRIPRRTAIDAELTFIHKLKVPPCCFHFAVRCWIPPVRRRQRHLSGPWVGLQVAFPKPVDGDVRVDLGSRKAAVPKNLLHGPQIGSPIQQMGRRAVPECVWPRG